MHESFVVTLQGYLGESLETLALVGKGFEAAFEHACRVLRPMAESQFVEANRERFEFAAQRLG